VIDNPKRHDAASRARCAGCRNVLIVINKHPLSYGPVDSVFDNR
jgi:hypothetical protein